MARNEPPTAPSEPYLSPSEIAQLDMVLANFGQSLHLPQGDPGRALADRSMRQIGFSVPQIMALSGNRLPESTIKHHVKGVSVPSSAPAQRAIELLTNAIDDHATIQSIHDFAEAKTIADQNKVSMKDLVDLVKALNIQKIPPNDFINDYKRMKELDLTPQNIRTFLDYKDKLERRGFGLNHLGLASKTSEKFGGPEQVLTAISRYSDLKDIQKAIKDSEKVNKTASEELERTERNTNLLKNEQSQLNEKIESANLILSRINRVKDLGYNETVLQDLAAMTKTLGSVGKAITALRKFLQKNELDTTILDLRREKGKLELDKTNMEKANAYLKTHIDATRKLIDEYGLGLDAIAALLRTAKKHGSAPEVLKAFESYDSLEQLNKAKKKLEIEIGVSRATLDELNSKATALRALIDKILPEITSNVKEVTKTFNNKLSETSTALESTLKSQSQEFKKTFNESLTGVKELRKTLDGDFETIKKTAASQVKTLTDHMKSSAETGSKDFTTAFEETKTSILRDISSVLEAAHEIDKAYAERESQHDKIKEFLQLLDVTENPASVSDIRFLATIEHILQKTRDWINLNEPRFRSYPYASDLRNNINLLLKALERVSFEPGPSA